MLSVSAVLKYVSVVLATVLGILGLTVDFRDKRTRRVTRGGWVLVALILAAGAIVVILQAIEDTQKNREREDLLDQMVRGQYALRDVRLSCWADVSMDRPELVTFRDRFIRDVTTALAALNAGAETVPGISGWGRTPGRPVDHISVCDSSALYPTATAEREAYWAFHALEISFRFYRVPIRVEAYPVHGYGSSPAGLASLVRPDLNMTFHTAYGNDDQLCLGYNFGTKSFELWGSTLTTMPRYWSSSGRIVSLVNLRGAQMFVEAAPLWLDPINTGNDRRAMPLQLRTMLLQVGELDGFWIRTDDMTRHTAADGTIFWEFRFPASMDEILALSSHN